jgi:hypothetical protein
MRVVAIRIDIHHVWENPTNTSHVFHAQSTYGPRSYVSHVVHIYQPFMKSSIAMDRATAPEKNGSRHNPQHDG